MPWDIAVGADLRYPAVPGPRSRKSSFLNAYVGRLHVAAERHPVVRRRFLSVANLMTSPQGLFAPGILARVLWSGCSGPGALVRVLWSGALWSDWWPGRGMPDRLAGMY
ncbi:hypothetical protein [Plantactinospora sp. B24E8]|uniref:hypothetical protein n=1 Tax=Plantactinospora sp. B24E8 TaxID=3153567 RepID=UPI00325CFC56